MTYENNITHSFDVTPIVCYKTLIPWLFLCYITIKTHKNDVIILLSTSQSHSPASHGSLQKFDNDYDVIFCVIIAYPTTSHGIWRLNVI